MRRHACRSAKLGGKAPDPLTANAAYGLRVGPGVKPSNEDRGIQQAVLVSQNPAKFGRTREIGGLADAAFDRLSTRIAGCGNLLATVAPGRAYCGCGQKEYTQGIGPTGPQDGGPGGCMEPQIQAF